MRTLEMEDIAAIVSSVPPAEIEAGLSSQPPDPKWIVPRRFITHKFSRLHKQVVPCCRFGSVA